MPPSQKFERLGWKTFWIFMLDNAKAAIAVLLLAILSSVFLGNNIVTRSLWGIFVLVLALVILATWLVYTRYGYMLDVDAFKMKRGVLGQEIVAIPYRQIQDIDIERSLFHRMFGVSKLAVLTAGHSDADDGQSDSEAEIPLLDKNLALTLQQELLSKANVQKVTQV
jgi:uncharacterized membrane protein YdbT with pleckstrin-like domain